MNKILPYFLDLLTSCIMHAYTILYILKQPTSHNYVNCYLAQSFHNGSMFMVCTQLGFSKGEYSTIIISVTYESKIYELKGDKILFQNTVTYGLVLATLLPPQI